MVIPRVEVVELSGIAATPPFASIIALIAVFIMRYEIAPASAATAFSFFAIPIATPIANSSGRLSKTTSPVLLMILRIVYKTPPSLIMPVRL